MLRPSSSYDMHAVDMHDRCSVFDAQSICLVSVDLHNRHVATIYIQQFAHESPEPVPPTGANKKATPGMRNRTPQMDTLFTIKRIALPPMVASQLKCPIIEQTTRGIRNCIADVLVLSLSLAVLHLSLRVRRQDRQSQTLQSLHTMQCIRARIGDDEASAWLTGYVAQSGPNTSHGKPGSMTTCPCCEAEKHRNMLITTSGYEYAHARATMCVYVWLEE